MKRTKRMELAKETVEICERGNYRSVNGSEIDIGTSIRACLESTRFCQPDELQQRTRKVFSQPTPGFETRIEVVNETTLSGIARLLKEVVAPVAALNFASAKNPGGGFLNGSHAQEESLARSSALYPSLLRARTFYEQHRASPSLLYSDAMIWTPRCAIFRNDDGDLLDEPHLATFITSPAPNAGAAGDTRPDELPHIPDVLCQRAEYVLALAASHGYKRLVLGAWGCGVFRNDPHVVANAFAHHLRNTWDGHFVEVTFSVFDNSSSGDTFRAFQQAVE